MPRTAKKTTRNSLYGRSRYLAPVAGALPTEPLAAEEERELALAAIAGCARSRDRLVTAHLPLAAKAAWRYKGCGVGEADLFQAGATGLALAADRFDPDHGARFATFATYYVRNEVSMLVYEIGDAVSLPTTAPLRTLFHHLPDLERAALRRDPSLAGHDLDAAIAVLAKTRATDVSFLRGLRSSLPPASLDVPPLGADGGDERVTRLAGPGDSPEEALSRAQEGARRKRLLKDALAALPGRLRGVLEARDLRGETLEMIACREGVSRERVRQLQVRALQLVERHVRAAASLEAHACELAALACQSSGARGRA